MNDRGSGNSKCKGPELGVCLIYAKNSKEASAAEACKGKVVENEVKKVAENIS